ncbi:hypothetical protein O6H91_01G028800 [Diphasiastrum complanatum]|nr:hypothetical protein O6H91_01G028800 [Diphasiastrum complanatum]
MESAASFQGQASVSFECNICLEVANDPVVTLCGHLFCWPCLYKWLQRSACKDCPVCKAAVEEEKVIPLYGRGNLQPVDPRTKSFPDIPKRPLGLRSNIVRSEQRYFSPGFFGYGAGAPTTVRLRGITLSTGLGFLPSLLSLQFNEFLDSAGGGYAGTSGAHGRFSHPYTPPPSLSTFVDRRQEAALMSKLVFLTVFVILCLFFL